MEKVPVSKTIREGTPSAIYRKANRKREIEGNTTAANRIRHMYKDEVRRKCQREFQQVMKPTGISKIMHIEVKDDANPNEVIQITDHDKMERHMMKNFKEKF